MNKVDLFQEIETISVDELVNMHFTPAELYKITHGRAFIKKPQEKKPQPSPKTNIKRPPKKKDTSWSDLRARLKEKGLI